MQGLWPVPCAYSEHTLRVSKQTYLPQGDDQILHCLGLPEYLCLFNNVHPRAEDDSLVDPAISWHGKDRGSDPNKGTCFWHPTRGLTGMVQAS